MRAAPLIAVLLALLLAPGLGAREADAPDAQAQTSTQLTTAPPALAADPLAQTFQQAYSSLLRERESFVRDFDWTSPAEPVARRRDYNRGLDDFLQRELELKRDWYQASGQTQLLAGVQALLERRANPPRNLPEIAGTRPAATPASPALTPEVTP